MTAHGQNPDDEAKPEAAATAPPAASDEDPTATPSATPPKDGEPEVDAKTEQTAPEAGPPSSKKSDKTKRAKRAKAHKNPGAKPQREQKPQDETAKVAGADSANDTPNLRCLKITRAVVPPLPSGILPPVIDKVFPDAGSRGALASALLAAATAAAGHAVGVAGGKDEGGILGLRVAVISDVNSLASIIAPVLQAAYAVQADETKTWMATSQTQTGQAAVAAVRQRLYRQTVANAAILGIDDLANAEVVPPAPAAVSAARPCFVLRDPIPTAVKQALANAGKGTLIVDGGRMTTMAGWGTNYLADLAGLLNGANAGDLLELADPLAHGAVRMRCACVSVIGMLFALDTFGLYKAKPEALASTVFAPVEAASKTVAANAAKGLMVVLGRLRALETEDDGSLRRLRLSADARKSLEQFKRKVMRASNDVLPPLADVYAGAGDLALRIAASLHLLDHAVGDGDELPTQMENAVMQRAVDFVEQYALPAARNVLGPASIDTVERNARRLMSCAQQDMEPEQSEREFFRHLRRGMGKMELKAAIRLLIDDGLLSPKTPGSGRIYVVHPLVFAPENRLPDLVGDPRRPKQ